MSTTIRVHIKLRCSKTVKRYWQYRLQDLQGQQRQHLDPLSPGDKDCCSPLSLFHDLWGHPARSAHKGVPRNILVPPGASPLHLSSHSKVCQHHIAIRVDQNVARLHTVARTPTLPAAYSKPEHLTATPPVTTLLKEIVTRPSFHMSSNRSEQLQWPHPIQKGTGNEFLSSNKRHIAVPCLDITVNVSVPVHVVKPSQHLFQDGCNDCFFQPLHMQSHFRAALPSDNESNCQRCQKQASPKLG